MYYNIILANKYFCNYATMCENGCIIKIIIHHTDILEKFSCNNVVFFENDIGFSLSNLKYYFYTL